MGIWFEDPLSAEEYLEQADEYFESGYVDLKDREYFYDDLNMAINCYENFSKALDYYKRALDLYEEDLLYLGSDSDEFRASVRCLKNIEACGHNIKIAKVNIAECYMDEAVRLWNNYDYDEARRMREKAIEWNRDILDLEDSYTWEF